tara:strand:- start:1844 stop:2422 length:579 start_codon:yes stop_codon:yes gene_type:complete
MTTDNRTSPWIQTYTGRKFYPLESREEDIDIADIAHALSLICRFAGHIRVFYSVAEHSVLVARITDIMSSTDDETKKLWLRAALLHDAHEAYTNDITTPLKIGFPKLAETQNVIQGLIVKKFNLSGADSQLIKRADATALALEARTLFKGKLIDGWELEEVPPKIKPLAILGGNLSTEDRFKSMFVQYGGTL